MCLCVCLSVCVSISCDVRGAGLDYSDVRPSYFYLLNLELAAKNVREHWAWAWAGIQQADVCNRGAAVEADAIGRAAVEVDAIGRAAVEAGAIWEQQLKRTRSGAAAEADASGEQQLEAEAAVEADAAIRPGSSSSSGEQQLKWTQSLCTESCPAPRISHGRRTRVK